MMHAGKCEDIKIDKTGDITVGGLKGVTTEDILCDAVLCRGIVQASTYAACASKGKTRSKRSTHDAC